ncbi:MAG TPA: NAD(P)/FAD-dependent oxidoreductase [Kiritimatiellia bacterium]|nr:NAD(P)/FAD-dependent oxidoreductase [Kiritimatiellia bacterium]HMP35228.1 NAD(P)/FAD-dependent oxidoreductase [Kiritimatiellia bacterium]
MNPSSTTTGELVILGAGPSGLSCAYELSQRGIPTIVQERHRQVGGLCRTMEFKGYLFDVGPHRFFTKNDEVDRLWHDLLGNEVAHVNRLTRILYRNRFFDYPLKPISALTGLGLFTSAHAVGSYAWSRMTRGNQPPHSFEDWVVSQFGKVLYEIFFKTYTEKVWGIPCSGISAEWAGQRIKGLSLSKAVINGLFPKLNRGSGGVKSLVDQFDYPQRGAGQVFEIMADRSRASGTRIDLGVSAQAIVHENKRIVAVESDTPGGPQTTRVQHLFSSIPLTEFILRLRPAPPAEVLEAARALYYRDHITVNLIVKKRAPFPDNWIYVHSPEVKVARISSYGNFSPGMLADQNKDALSVEYFAFAHEDIWQMSDAELVKLGVRELVQLGLIEQSDFEDGFIIRERDSYPTYYLGYKHNLDTIRAYVDQFANLTLVGRGGMYRYNNQDHAMLSGLLAARNFTGVGKRYNLWEINEEDEYLEEKQLPSPMHAGNQ